MWNPAKSGPATDGDPSSPAAPVDHPAAVLPAELTLAIDTDRGPLMKEEDTGESKAGTGSSSPPPQGPAAALAARIARACDHGYRLRLQHGSDRLDLPEERDDLASWLDDHPEPQVHFRTGFPSPIVAVIPWDEHAKAACTTEAAIVLQTDSGWPAYLFSVPPDHVLLSGETHESPSFTVCGLNESVQLASDADGCPMPELSADLPPMPDVLVGMVRAGLVPIDGSPLFREMGLARSGAPWWTTDARLQASPQSFAEQSDATTTLCVYLEPDVMSAHVCDLVLESDYHESDGLARAREVALALVDRLLNQYGVPAEAIRLVFTGSKSIHIRVSWRCFGQKPRVDGHRIMRAVAEEICAGIADEYDRTLYDVRHKSRIPGTQHSGTGRWAIPLTIEELRTLSADDLRRRASVPPDLVPDEPERHEVVPALAGLWKKHAARPGRDRPRDAPTGGAAKKGDKSKAWKKGRTRGAPPRAARNALGKVDGHPACIAGLLAGMRTLVHRRNVVTTTLASYAKTLGMNDLERRRLFREAARYLGSHDMDAAKCERRLHDAYKSAARNRDGTYTYDYRSCGSLRAAGLPCSRSCPVQKLKKYDRRRPGSRHPEPLPPGVDPPPVPEILSAAALERRLDAERRSMRQAIREAMAGNGVVHIDAPPGIGKTTIMVEDAAQLMRTSTGGVRVVWFADRHTQLEIIRKKLPGMLHLRGRSGETCDRFDQVDAYRKAGWGHLVTRELCIRCPYHPRNVERSGMQSCEYQAQRRDRNASWGCVHDYLSLTDAAEDATLVVIDENIVKACVRDASFGPRDLDRAADVELRDEQSAGRLRQVLSILAKLDLGTAHLGPAQLREAIEKQTDVAALPQLIDGINWAGAGPGIAHRLPECDSDWMGHAPSRRSPAPNPRPLIECLRDLLRGRAAGVRWSGRRWEVRWVERPRLGSAPVIVLDATADHAILERLLGRPVETRRFHVPFSGAVMQIVDATYPRSSLMESDGTPKRRTVDRLLRVVAERAARCAGRTLLVVHKKLEDNYLKEGAPGHALLPDSVKVMHYGGLRGADCSEYEQVVLLGYPFVSTDEVAFTASALWQGDEPVRADTVEQVVPYVAINDFSRRADNPVGHPGGPVGLRVRGFVDRRAESVRRLVEGAEFFQALNRVRQINDPNKVSIVLSSRPFGREYGVPVRLVDLDGLANQPRMRRPRTSRAADACAEFLDTYGFVVVSEVLRMHPGLSESTVRRAVAELVAARRLAPFSIPAGETGGRPVRAHGDPEACRRYFERIPLDVTFPDDAVPDPVSATSRNDVGNEFPPNAVLDLSSTAFGGNPLERGSAPLPGQKREPVRNAVAGGGSSGADDDGPGQNWQESCGTGGAPTAAGRDRSLRLDLLAGLGLHDRVPLDRLADALDLSPAEQDALTGEGVADAEIEAVFDLLMRFDEFTVADVARFARDGPVRYGTSGAMPEHPASAG